MPDEVYGDAFEKLGGCIFRRPVSIPVPFVMRSPHVSPNVPGAFQQKPAFPEPAASVPRALSPRQSLLRTDAEQLSLLQQETLTTPRRKLRRIKNWLTVFRAKHHVVF